MERTRESGRGSHLPSLPVIPCGRDERDMMMAMDNRSAGETGAAVRCEGRTGATTRVCVCHNHIMRCVFAQ
jgi:hypothetical protein